MIRSRARVQSVVLDLGTMVAPSYIDTGMFDGIKMRFPLLLPILQQERVAARIVKAVRRGTAELQMPALVNTIDALRDLRLERG